ncbi:hypothetical protein ACHAWX_005436 [Stephanocyclus meneghinianus]
MLNKQEENASECERLPSTTVNNSESEHNFDLAGLSEEEDGHDTHSKDQTHKLTHDKERSQPPKKKQGRIRAPPKPNIRRHENYEQTGYPDSSIKSISKDVTTSEWVLVSNIPPMSKLSDLFPSLSEILEFEIKKGIIDLDKLLNNKDNANHASPSQNQESHDRLKAIHALPSLYTSQTIRPNTGIPLWTFHPHPNKSLPAQLILEARLHLSYRARPAGWFLRFSNRSVAHAVRCHVREAEKHEALMREQFDGERRAIRRERREWTEGLWRRVWEDCEAEGVAKKNASMLEKEGGEERELMWGDDSLREQGLDESDIADSGVDVETFLGDDMELQGDSVRGNPPGGQSVDEFFDEYSRSHPYPMQSTEMPSVESVFGYHHLKCGSATLRIQEFTPTDLHSETKQPSWEQNSFHLGNLLDLSDSVVRVENSALTTTVDEVNYLFRGYDLKSIWPDLTGHKEHLPSWLVDLPKSIGWNLSRYDATDNVTSQVAVDILLKGKNRDKQFSHGNRQQDKTIDRPTQNMFIVRFATPADARMAVRDKQGIELNKRRLLLSQYPRVDMV